MAHMQPEEIPIGSRVTKSERALFEALRTGLSDDFWVYHSLPFLEPDRAEQGEADFLVVHRELGMLVVECKGYGVRRRPDGVWVREYRGKEKPLAPTPTEQAAKQLSQLLSKFNKPLRRALPGFHGTFPLVYGWALAFPFTRWDTTELPPEFEPEVIFDCDALTDIAARVEGAFEFHHRRFDRKPPPALSAGEFRRLREEVFCPEVNLVPNLAGAIEEERRAMLRLSEEQARVVRFFMNNARVRVSGAAGTGKTVLAQHGAALLAREGKDVLLICFNKNLRDHLRESVADLSHGAGKVEVTSFHSLCGHAHWKLYDRQMDVPVDEVAAGAFWVDRAPRFVLEALEVGIFDGWDAIVVDEGQDFATSWWDVLEAGLRDDTSRLCVFYDQAQTIFTHGDNVPAYPTLIPLDENFRNTRRITEAIGKLGVAEMRSHQRCSDGVEPTVLSQPDAAALRRLLDELVSNLVHEERLRPDQIVILTPRSPANSSLGELSELGGVQVVHARADRAKGVLHSSISGFKGLEADTVILVDIDPSDARCDRNSRYVAASRACHRLYVFEKGDWLDCGAL